jgi:RNA polymerase sigma factor (sigma-70 family)
MATIQPHDLLSPLPPAVPAPDRGALTDGQLLECFLRRKDEAAFEAVVRRHGPMVIGVCRRVLRHPQDVEDAFQATFLVLVRKAAAIGQRELLGNWLYGVAYRTALDARAAAGRRRVHERQVSQMPEPAATASADADRDLRPILDQELSRLPDKYRLPVVLCDLEGRTRRDVARQLGIPAGTLSGRLTTAHRMLARRLARHDFTFSVGALPALLSADTAGVPAPLVTATAQAVTAGRGAAGAVSAQVAALAEGVVKGMLLKTLRLTLTVLLAAGVIVGAAALALQGQNANGAKVLRLGMGQRGRRVAWSPDGKTLMVVTIHEHLIFGRKGSAINLWDVETGTVRKTLAESAGGGLAFQSAVFSADGKTIAATVSEQQALPGGGLRFVSVVKLWDAKTLALKRTLGRDSNFIGVALSPDGKHVAAADPSKKTIALWNAETGALERTLTASGQTWSVAFSPDGKAIAGTVGGKEVHLWNARTGTLAHVWKDEGISADKVLFSPDGKMVAAGGGNERIHVWAVEGGKAVATLKGDKHYHRTFAFSPDSRLLAAGGPDGKVRVWEVKTGRLWQTLEGHDDEVFAVAFSPDGKTLASTSQDQTVRLSPVSAAPGQAGNP